MCLDQVSFTKKGMGTKVRYGYKIFTWDDRSAFPLRFPMMSNSDGFAVGQGKWLTSKQRLIHGGNRYYKSGFHIYKYQVQALSLLYANQTLVKVKYKGVLASGVQNSSSVVVAKQMYVPKRGKNWSHRGPRW